MSGELRASGYVTAVPGARFTYRRMTIDELRAAMERPLFPGQDATAYAVAHTLLAEIDRLRTQVEALERRHEAHRHDDLGVIDP